MSASVAVLGPRAKLGMRSPNFMEFAPRSCRVLGVVASSSLWLSSAQPVLFLRLVDREAADARMRPASVGDDESHQDLVGTGSIGKAHLHRVEVGAHERRVLVVKRHVDGGTRAAELLRRWDDGLAASHRLPERRAESRMEDGGGVLVLAALADDRGFAVRMHRRGHCRRGAAADELAQLLARLDQLLEILYVASREGVLDHRHGGDLLDRLGSLLSTVFVDLL